MMKRPDKITIILADDHELIRDGFRSFLKKLKEVELLAEASNGEELFALVRRFLPDIVITDVKMPLMDGIEATRMIKQRYPYIRVIALSNYDEMALINEMLEAGAHGYLIKNVAKHQLIEAIHAVRSGNTYYCSTTSAKVFTHSQKNLKYVPPVVLTKRERELVKLISKGMSNQEIAIELRLSKRTVESHRLSVQEKLGLKTPVAIALYALQHGYFKENE
jgi:DNA-binding NarL/FixJ family response regulator